MATVGMFLRLQMKCQLGRCDCIEKAVELEDNIALCSDVDWFVYLNVL
jgi:hypothetical protein